MKKSLCIEMFFTDAPFEERFRLAKGAGFDYIEFWSWTDKDIPRIRDLCRRYDLGIASFSGDRRISLIDENRRKEYLKFVEESMEVAGFLGCKNLVIHSNGLGDGGIVLDPYDHLSRRTKDHGHGGHVEGACGQGRKRRGSPCFWRRSIPGWIIAGTSSLPRGRRRTSSFRRSPGG